jgi:hypothetical protein
MKRVNEVVDGMARTLILGKSVEERVAAEPGLTASMNRRELQAARRDFASSNHPDKWPREGRLEAENRMKIANAMVDAAIK